MKIALPIFIIAITGWFCGCIKQPEIGNISNVKLLPGNVDTLKLTGSINVNNPNSFSFRLTESDVQVFFAGAGIGKVILPSEMTLEKGDNLVTDARIEIPQKFLNSLMPKALGQDSLQFHIKGKTKFNYGFIKWNSDFEKDIYIHSSAFLGSLIPGGTDKLVKLKDATLETVSLDHSVFIVKIEITNPMPVAITLEQYPADIFINGRKAGKGNLTAPLSIEPGGKTAEGEFRADLNNFQSAMGALSSLFSGKLEYRISGELKLQVQGQIMKIPFSHKGNLVQL